MLPLFLAVRQVERSFEEAYYEGKFSQMAKRIFTLLEEEDAVSYHDMKSRLHVSKEDSKEFERALLELQGKLYITLAVANKSAPLPVNRMDGPLQYFLPLRSFLVLN
jgi:hypothetical protein